MLVLSGATLVLPDRLMSPGTLVVEGDRIIDVRPGDGGTMDGSALPLSGFLIVPGFIDVHVHGIAGTDTLGGPGVVPLIAAQLPRYGVTAFCPTSVACEPRVLRTFLDDVRDARAEPEPRGARVLPAHLESNFINPAFAGAQPARCLRSPAGVCTRIEPFVEARREGARPHPDDYDGRDILDAISAAAPDVGIVTLASELDGGLDLVRWLAGRGHQVSLGHSGATFEEAMAAIDAGARRVTHLFNRMPTLHHRAPGLAGAALQAPQLAAEIVADGVHVHPAMIRTAVATKGPGRVMAVSDGTAASTLSLGSRARLGEHTIVADRTCAVLDDGTMAGSVATMDRMFRILVEVVGLSLVDAAALCSTTPARELGLVGHGMLTAGAVADFVLLDRELSVVQTYIAGRPVHTR
ncbi:MAG: N-acetylglucosamine-6-phosphate deacetylase [Vicinamibacterales bacterium]